VIAAEPATPSVALLRPRLVDRQAAPFELALVERAARGPALGFIGHLDEAEAARLPGRPIADETDGHHLADGREELLELGLAGIERKISYVQSHVHILEKVGNCGLDSFWSVQERTVRRQNKQAGSNVSAVV
jgi:hypothetical protein